MAQTKQAKTELAETVSVLRGSKAFVTDIAVSPDGSSVLSAGGDGIGILWNVKNKSIVATKKDDFGEIAFDSRGTFIVNYRNGRLTILDAQGLNSVKSSLKPARLHLVYNPNTNSIASLYFKSGGFVVYSGDINNEFGNPIEVSGQKIISLALQSDADVVAMLNDKGVVILADMRQKRVIKAFQTNISENLCFSPDGNTVAGRSGGKISLWDVETGKQKTGLEGFNGLYGRIAFSPNGRYVSAAGDKNVNVWSVETGKIAATLTGHTERVLTVKFSQDGGKLFSAGHDSTIRVWNLNHFLPKTGQTVQGKPLLVQQNRQSSNIPKIWAVVVGVSDYQSTGIRDLKYADNDATAFYRFLKSSNGGGVADDQIALLTNTQATRSNILKVLTDKFYRAFEDDLVVLYIAGHGQPDPVGNELYFMGNDTDTDNLAGTAISQFDIERVFGRSRAKKKIWIADVCHSGGIGWNTATYRSDGGAALTHRLLQQIANANEGMAMFTASSSSEFSEEDAKWGGGHGVFTHFLLQGLGGKADDKPNGNANGLVSIRELYEYTYRAVTDATGGKQHPELKGSFDNSLPLGVLR